MMLTANVKSISNSFRNIEKISFKDISNLVNDDILVTVSNDFQTNFDTTNINTSYQINHCENMMLFMNFLLYESLKITEQPAAGVKRIPLIHFILSILVKSSTSQTEDFYNFLSTLYVDNLYDTIGNKNTLLNDDEYIFNIESNIPQQAHPDQQERCAKLFKQRMLYTLLVSLLDFKTINSTYKSILSPMNPFTTIHTDQIYQNFNNNMPFRSGEYSNKNFGKSLFSMFFNNQFLAPTFNTELLKFMSIFSYTLTGSEYYNTRINDFNRGNFIQSIMFENNKMLSIDQFYAIIFILFDAGINNINARDINVAIERLYNDLNNNDRTTINRLKMVVRNNIDNILRYMNEWDRYIRETNNEVNGENKVGTTSFDYASISKDFDIDGFFGTDKYFTMDYNIDNNIFGNPRFEKVGIRQGKIKAAFQVSPANCSLNLNNNNGEIFFDIEGDYRSLEIDPRELSKIFVKEIIYYLFNNITAFIDFGVIREELKISQLSEFIQSIHNCINMELSQGRNLLDANLVQSITTKVLNAIRVRQDPDIERFTSKPVYRQLRVTDDNIRRLVREVVQAKISMRNFHKDLYNKTVVTANLSSMHLISLHVYIPVKCNYADLRTWIIKMQKIFGKMHGHLMLDSQHTLNKYDHVFEYLDPNVYVDSTHILRVPYCAKGFNYESDKHTMYDKYYNHNHMLNLIKERGYKYGNRDFNPKKSQSFKAHFKRICSMLNEKVFKPILRDNNINSFIIIPNLYDYHRIIIRQVLNPDEEREKIKEMFKRTVLSPNNLFEHDNLINWSSPVHTLTFDKFFMMSEYFLKRRRYRSRGYNGLNQMNVISFRKLLENNWLNFNKDAVHHKVVDSNPENN